MLPPLARKVDPEVLEGFLDEALGYLPQIRAGLDALAGPAGTGEPLAATDSQDPRLEEAHRQAHCITGAAAMVGLNGLSRIAQKLEYTLEEVAAGRLQPDATSLAALRRSVTLIETYLNATRHNSPGEDYLLDEAAELFPDPPAGVATAGPGASATGGRPPVADAPASPVATPAEEADPELLATFTHEAEGHLRTINRLLPLLLDRPEDQAVLQEVRRCAHTLKGSAAMVGHESLTRLSHRMEDLLDLLYEEQRRITPEAVALLLAATDALEELAAGQGDPETLDALYAGFDQVLAHAAPADEPPALVPDAPTPAANIVAAPAAPPVVTAAPGSPAERYVRVPLERLDEMVRLVSELVIARGALEQQLAAYGRQIEELQLSTERLQRGAGQLEARYGRPGCAASCRTG
jgi:chemotaxis protein histidine kinase CheA